jgi:putative molybdopterin biosynthesis protein
MDELLLTPQEVADLLKIKKNTVYELIKRGELKCNKIGKQFRISKSQLDEYLYMSNNIEDNDSTGYNLNINNISVSKVESTSESINDSTLELEQKEIRNFVIKDKHNNNKGVVICGQDMILDLLSNHMEQYFEDTPFLRSYQGSYNGLFNLYQDKVQVATVHLWDHITGEYNKEFVHRMLPGTRYKRIHLIKRMQGFYVKKGNPKNIEDFKDLLREDVIMINREKGSGTRILLDEYLIKLGMDHNRIQGYEKEVTSHLAGASAVARGQVDVSIGNENTIRQLSGVEFVPIQQESVDIVVKEDLSNRPWYDIMLKILKSKDFKEEVLAISNYDVTNMGEVVKE